MTELEKSGITCRDLMKEVLAGLFSRPGRTVLTIMGVVMGIAALVATLGLSQTAGNRIIGRFDELAATEIVITAKSQNTHSNIPVLPWDSPERLLRLNGVVAAGTLSMVAVDNALVRASLVSDPLKQTRFQLSVQAASPGLFSAVRSELHSGRYPDRGNSDRADRVAVIGSNAAIKLGITGVEQLPAIMIGDNLYLVIGILGNVGRQPDLLSSVIIPEGTARKYFNLGSPQSVLIETKIGAASLIAHQSPLALRPDNPSILKIAAPSEPQRVRNAVQSDLNILFLLLGAVSLLVGSIGIANVTLVSVVERTGEIGLRRANGATRLHIALQFLLESGAIGIIGGILGASLGVLIIVGVSFHQNWTAVLDPVVSLTSPLVGGIVGIVSGLYPSIRAAKLEPVDALRSGT